MTKDSHTQNIEAFWSVFKRKLRRQGLLQHAGNDLNLYFGEHMWKIKTQYFRQKSEYNRINYSNFNN